MRILLTFPFSLGIPGGGTYAFLQTARYLKAAGVEVTVVFVQGGGLKLLNRRPLQESRSGEEQIEMLRDLGIEVLPVPVYRWSFLIDAWTVRRVIDKYASQKSVDTIIGWHQEVAFLRGICDKHKMSFIIRAAGNYKSIRKHKKGPIWSWLIFQQLQRGFQKADIIWATSDFTRQDVIDTFRLNPEKVIIVPEGINPDFFLAKRERDSNAPIRNFLFFGQWTETKGVFDTFQAFGKIAAEGNKDWKLKIAGWGEEDCLRKSIQKNGIEDQVEVLGRLEHSALIKTLEEVEVVILPSQIESFGLAVAEAQASGAPVIAYATGAIPEIIENRETGWLVPLQRTDLLAQAIKESMADPQHTYQMGLAGRKKIATLFSWDQTTDRYLSEIQTLKESHK